MWWWFVSDWRCIIVSSAHTHTHTHKPNTNEVSQSRYTKPNICFPHLVLYGLTMAHRGCEASGPGRPITTLSTTPCSPNSRLTLSCTVTRPVTRVFQTSTSTFSNIAPYIIIPLLSIFFTAHYLPSVTISACFSASCIIKIPFSYVSSVSDLITNFL